MAYEVLTRQALIHGRVTDAITGAAPRARVALAVLRDVDGGILPGVEARVMGNGAYVVHTDPATGLAEQQIGIRLEFRAEGYQPREDVLTFTAADLGLALDTFDLKGETLGGWVHAGAPRVHEVSLSPEPVFLGGRVTRAEDHSQPIAGAEVALTAPAALGPVRTDGGGYFTLGPAAVVAEVTVSVTAAGREPLSRAVRLDYREPVNLGAYALEPS
jgi:hypothetical protein